MDRFVKLTGLTLVGLMAVAVSSYPGAIGVLTTTTIIGDVVSQIGSDDIDLTVLLPVNADPHSFEPTPKEIAAISDADIVFINGAGLELGLKPFLDAAEGRIVALSDYLPLRRLEAQGEGEEGGEWFDPHVWFDPRNVMTWSAVIAKTLGEFDPAHRSEYEERTAEYRSELERLDSWIEEEVEKIPPENRKLVTDHAAFGYFAARYGFEQVGTVFPGFSTLSDPSARELADLEDKIRSLSIPAIFVGTTVNPALAERIAADTNTKVVFLYTGSLSGPDGPAGNYIDLMRYDVEAIVSGLSGEK